MCELFGLTVPPWADPAAASVPEVAFLRNEMIHEALFMGQPLGFAIDALGTTHDLTLEMEARICRLIVTLMGAQLADYVHSPVNTRQRHGLNLG